MQPNWANERGYFEPLDLAEIHDESLASVGSSWEDWREFPTEWFESSSASDYAEILANVFMDDYGGAECSVLKEPRICRILPLWDRVLRSILARPL